MQDSYFNAKPCLIFVVIHDQKHKQFIIWDTFPKMVANKGPLILKFCSRKKQRKAIQLEVKVSRSRNKIVDL